MKKIALVVFIFFSLFVPVAIISHPHLFIQPKIRPQVENNILKGFHVEWHWDEWWSKDVVSSADVNRNGTLEENEIKHIHDNFFIGVREFDFFTSIHVNNKRVQFSNVSNFTAAIKPDKKVFYSFYIPVNVDISSGGKVIIEMNDPTIFASFDELSIVSEKISDVKNGRSGFYGVKVEFNLQK